MATKHPAYEKFDLEIRGGQEMEEGKKAAGVARREDAIKRTEDLAKTDRGLKNALTERDAREEEELKKRFEEINRKRVLEGKEPLKIWFPNGITITLKFPGAPDTPLEYELKNHPAYQAMKEDEDIEIETGTELREAKEAAGVSTPEEARKRQADLAELDPKLKEELEKREKREKEEGEK